MEMRKCDKREAVLRAFFATDHKKTDIFREEGMSRIGDKREPL